MASNNSNDQKKTDYVPTYKAPVFYRSYSKEEARAAFWERMKKLEEETSSKEKSKLTLVKDDKQNS